MNKIDILRKHLAEGEEQADRGEFVKNFSMDALIKKLDDENQNLAYLKAEIQKGLDYVKAGRIINGKTVFEDLRKLLQ